MKIGGLYKVAIHEFIISLHPKDVLLKKDTIVTLVNITLLSTNYINIEIITNEKKYFITFIDELHFSKFFKRLEND